MISRKSQQSQWVPKEASIALSLKKIVIPFVMENCELTESFNFFLTDVQRYNAYEQQSESMSLLIDRIKNECHTNKADTNNKEDGHITKIYSIERTKNGLGLWFILPFIYSNVCTVVYGN